jgi:hypothetical protein
MAHPSLKQLREDSSALDRRYWSIARRGLLAWSVATVAILIFLWHEHPDFKSAKTGALIGLISAGVPGLCLVVGMFIFASRNFCEQHFRCSNCGKHLSSYEPWECGICGEVNVAPGHEFIKKCWRCKSEPEGFVCPHCGEAFFPEQTGSPNNWASSLNKTLVATPKSREEKLADAKHEIELNLLLAERERSIAAKRIAESKNDAMEAPTAPMSMRDRLQNDLIQERDRQMALTEIVADELKRIRAQYANNPEMLAREEEFLEYFREREIAKLRL